MYIIIINLAEQAFQVIYDFSMLHVQVIDFSKRSNVFPSMGASRTQTDNYAFLL